MTDFETGTMKGTVKTFISDERGEFGFIVPDDGSADIFFHATTVWELDLTITPKQGDRVEVAYITVTEGKNTGGRRASQVTTYEVHEPAPATNQKGQLKWFKPEKGFGFVTPADGGADVFIHRSVIEKMMGSVHDAPVGATLEFRVGPDRQGRDQVIWFSVVQLAPTEATRSPRSKKSRPKKPRQHQEQPSVSAQ